ncbi:MAG: hypothetical protein M3Y74_12240 [Chloroflexota bacterium]|nr:hypothetical protein [Chloroflexota bacterium]
MAIYGGVIRGNRVELDDDARLVDGARVEVRAGPDALTISTASGAIAADTAAAERALTRDLLAAGLLDELPSDEFAADEPFEPVATRGEPLSEQVIRERR